MTGQCLGDIIKNAEFIKRYKRFDISESHERQRAEWIWHIELSFTLQTQVIVLCM